jgi:PAS domain S-box-containing protein
MGALMRAHDWSHSRLGAVSQWPKSLRVAVRILLGTGYPMYIAWGPEFIQLYNDAYRPILGRTKHPAALGIGTPQTFREIWDFIGPMFRRVLAEGEATTLYDQLLMLDRNGYPEECYYTFSYSPIPSDDESITGGVLVTVIETTERILEERRLRTLRDLAASSDTQSEHDVCRFAAKTLAQNQHDLPFSLLYLNDPEKRKARLAGLSGIGADHPAAASEIDLDAEDVWPLGEVAQLREPTVVHGLRSRFENLPRGPWASAPDSAVVWPIPAPAAEAPLGFLVAGINAHKQLDENYRTFVGRVASQLATSISDVRAYESERKRAELLAELDRAKTTFFSNISHEFRTPLTLMIGPLEQLLQQAEPLSETARARIEIAHRNSLRLLKLVNNLLDFSRIEAGRISAIYEQVDLSQLTAELASGFRSAIERAGLELRIECAPIADDVYVDRDMWEKIVLNLLSNAFKFTLKGSIAVEQKQVGDTVQLSVRDTGTGIPESELPNLFRRFHRVEGAQGRSYEGSGIGLALVQELVKLHGGSVTVESKEGVGTTFKVAIPTGTAHLPAEHLGRTRQAASTATRVDAFVNEALRWIPGQSTEVGASLELDRDVPEVVHSLVVKGRRVLVVDDNADMREYVARLLGTTFKVEAVNDGVEALKAIQRDPPDLILSDVMMPRLDGLGLLQRLRSNPETNTLPVILLSARAGEDARIQGLSVGADDYLTKPFTARELLARITSLLEISILRRTAEMQLRESESRFRLLVEQSPISMIVYDPAGRIVEINPAFAKMWGIEIDKLPPNYSVLHNQQLERTGMLTHFKRAFAGETVHIPAIHYDLSQTTIDGKGPAKWVEATLYPVRDSNGNVVRVVLLHTDITARMEAEQALRATEERADREARRVREILESTSDAVVMLDHAWRFSFLNNRAKGLLAGGRDLIGLNIWEEFPAAVGRTFWEHYHRVMEERVPVEFEEYYPAPLDKSFGVHAYPTEEGIAVFFHDITERKKAEQALRQTEKLAAAGRLAASISHEINNPLEAITNLLYLLETSKTLDEGDRKYLMMAQSELARVSQIAIQTLRFYRQATKPAETSISELLESVLELYRGRLNQAEITVVRQFQTNGVQMAFGGELRQVFANIVGNALDASRAGGKLVVRVRNGRDPRNGAPGVRVSIADTGHGMNADTLKHIFEPFFTTKGNTGTGLGLWVSQEIVEKHQGRLNVRSSDATDRHGTVFSLFLPSDGVRLSDAQVA